LRHVGLRIIMHSTGAGIVDGFRDTGARWSVAMGPSFRAIAEMKEFATFSPAAQRYIRRSLDVAMDRRDTIDLWARSADEIGDIRTQARIYSRLGEIRMLIPMVADNLSAEPLVARLLPLSTYDLSRGKIESFSAYRFLYERLLGTRSRPWLPACFLSAAALPSLHPEQRRVLLTSMSEAAATARGWSTNDLGFFPTWVDKVEIAAA